MRLGRFVAAPHSGKQRSQQRAQPVFFCCGERKPRQGKQNKEKGKKRRERGERDGAGESQRIKAGQKRSRRISERREARFGPGAPSRRTGRQGGRPAKKGSAPFGCANAPTGCGQGFRSRPLRPKARRCLDETLETPLRAAAQIAQPRRGPGQAPRDPDRNALGQAARAVAAKSGRKRRPPPRLGKAKPAKRRPRAERSRRPIVAR